MVDLAIIGNTAGQGVALPAIIAGAGKRARTDVWYMVRRRVSDAGVETPPIRFHTLPCYGNYGLPDQRRPHRGRAPHGQPCERENHEPL
jgi:hypothetical protein